VRPETSLALASVPPKRWRTVALALLTLPTLLVRLWLIRHFPEPDTDAAGHLGIARAVLADPTNVAVHWVYLPAYHFVLAGFLLLGLTADGIRLVNCALAALVPVLVLHYVEGTADRREGYASRYVSWMAAAFCAISPLVNLLGTSAQQETVFTLLVLGAVCSIDRDRYALAGALLGLASLIRYEAWGAVVLVLALSATGRWLPAIVTRLPLPLARACRLPLVVAVPSIVAVAGWLLAHRLREGQWFGVLRELYRYTQAQRESLHRDVLWFPVEQPLFVFGSVVAILFFAGLRRCWRPSHVIPLGIYLFLLGAYLFKGALGSARYYESLMPFVAISAAHGVWSIGARWRWMSPAVFVVASLQLVALSTQLFLWTWPPVASAHTSAAAAVSGPGPVAAGDGRRSRATISPGPGTRPSAAEARSSRN
jgi:hypothetical protein